MIQDNLNPPWKIFLVDYDFELQQQLKVDIIDHHDSSSNKLVKSQYREHSVREKAWLTFLVEEAERASALS